jgi:hypothetical protein
MESCLLLHMQTNVGVYFRLFILNMKIVNLLVEDVGANGASCKCDYTFHYHILHVCFFTFVFLLDDNVYCVACRIELFTKYFFHLFFINKVEVLEDNYVYYY